MSSISIDADYFGALRPNLEIMHVVFAFRPRDKRILSAGDDEQLILPEGVLRVFAGVGYGFGGRFVEVLKE